MLTIREKSVFLTYLNKYSSIKSNTKNRNSLNFPDFSSILSKFPWLFQSAQNSLTFPWLEKVLFFQVFQSMWEPCVRIDMRVMFWNRIWAWWGFWSLLLLLSSFLSFLFILFFYLFLKDLTMYGIAETFNCFTLKRLCTLHYMEIPQFITKDQLGVSVSNFTFWPFSEDKFLRNNSCNTNIFWDSWSKAVNLLCPGFTWKYLNRW